MTEAPSDSVHFDILVPSEVRAGETVPIALRVENRGADAATLYLGGRTITFDVIVARDDGAVVWQRLKGAVVQSILQVRMVAPGEVLELRTTWNQRGNDGSPVGAGSYQVRGELHTDQPSPMTTPTVALRVVER